MVDGADYVIPQAQGNSQNLAGANHTHITKTSDKWSSKDGQYLKKDEDQPKVSVLLHYKLWHPRLCKLKKNTTRMNTCDSDSKH